MSRRHEALADTAAVADWSGEGARDGAVPGIERAHVRLVRRAVTLAMSHKSLALMDQALVSGASFGVTVMVGRYADAGELGIYALAGSILIWLTNAQESLVSVPYTMRRQQAAALDPRAAGHALALNNMLGLLSALGIGLVGLTLLASGGDIEIFGVIVALAAIAPFVIHRELARRVAFAEIRVGEALVLDAFVAGLQIGLLGWLAVTGELTSMTALAVLGLSCAVAGLGWLLVFRRRFRMRRSGLAQALTESWAMGKWLFANQLFGAIQSQVTYWILAVAASVVATGIYIACMSIALIVNPIVLGLSNVLWAKAALALREGGCGRLLKESVIDAAILAIVIGAFCVLIAFVGDAALRLLYRGPDYIGYGHVVTILAFAQLAFAINMPASIALSGLGWLRANALVAAFETVLTIVLAWPMVVHWGVPGAAYAILIGAIVRCIARWGLLVMVVRAMQLQESGRGGEGGLPPSDRVMALCGHLMSRTRFYRGWTVNPWNGGRRTRRRIS